jgi:insulin receptor
VNGVVKFTLHDQRESQIIPLTVQERPGYDTNVDFSVTVNSYFPWENQSSLLHPIETVNFTMPGVINSSDLGLVIGICVASVLAAVLLVAVVVTGVYVRRVKKREKIRLNSVNEVLTNFKHLSISGEDEYEVDEWEVDCNDVTLGAVLGEGAFGTVCLGSLRKDDEEIKVAVKMLAPDSSYADKLLFLKEASVMKKFNSDHIVRLLGIVSGGDPALVIMELMSCGDLKQYLKSLRPEGAPADLYDVDPMPLTIDELLQMAAEIAAGMAYLASRKFVHRYRFVVVH